MNSKFFIAVLVTALAAFLGGWLIFGLALAGFYTSNINLESLIIMKSPTILWAMIVGIISWAVLITWVLQKTGSNTFAKGFATSLWVSFLMVLIFDLNMFSMWAIYDLDVIIVDILVSTVFWGLIGGIAGWILGTERKRRSIATA